MRGPHIVRSRPDHSYFVQRRLGAPYVGAFAMTPAERIAAAPRAWAIKVHDYLISFRDTCPFKEDAELEAEGQHGARARRPRRHC